MPADLLVWGVLLVFGATYGSLRLTKELRDRTDSQPRRRVIAVVLLVVAAYTIAGAGLVLGSRPEDHTNLLISSMFALMTLLRAAVLVAQWGTTDKPSLLERVVRDLIGRPISG